MQPAHNLVPLLSKPRLDEVERVLADNLSHNWVIHIEHADDVNSRTTRWQQWGKPLFASNDSSSLLNDIQACLTNHPTHTVRLNAEKYNPQVRFVYWVYRPDYDAALIAQPEQQVTSVNSGVSRWVSLLGDSIKAARSRLWRIITVTGMVLASLLLLEEVMA
jgi:ribulose bisphosphate carboxylase small subunit